eukprot:SAG11_NODE_1385_length_5070_cov_3.950915_10_plen_82_part_01
MLNLLNLVVHKMFLQYSPRCKNTTTVCTTSRCIIVDFFLYVGACFFVCVCVSIDVLRTCGSGAPGFLQNLSQELLDPPGAPG